jgi:DnaJ-domain-containing protein 1
MDCFARLQIQRQPWLERDTIQAKFLELSSQHHPDRFQNPQEKALAEKQFAELNNAQQTLRAHNTRLAHLLELETGEKLTQMMEIPTEAMQFFNDVAKITRGLEKFFAEKNPLESPMLHVHYFERALEWTDLVQALQSRIVAESASLEEELKKMNPAWQSAPPPTGHSSTQARVNALPIPRLRSLASAFSFLEKWNSQLQEKLARLAQLA